MVSKNVGAVIVILINSIQKTKVMAVIIIVASTNNRKHSVYTNFFEKLRVNNFCLLPCDMGQEPNGNCSANLVQTNFYILCGFLFRADFPPLTIARFSLYLGSPRTHTHISREKFLTLRCGSGAMWLLAFLNGLPELSASFEVSFPVEVGQFLERTTTRGKPWIFFGIFFSGWMPCP